MCKVDLRLTTIHQKSKQQFTTWQASYEQNKIIKEFKEEEEIYSYCTYKRLTDSMNLLRTLKVWKRNYISNNQTKN